MPKEPKEIIRSIALTVARPDKVEEVQSILEGLIEPTRQEKGCLLYELWQNGDDPTDFVLVEEWESKEALEKHFTSPHMLNMPDPSSFVAAPPDIRRYQLIK